MSNLETIITLVRDAKTLQQYQDIFKEATSSSSCDKYGVGFNKDDRFSAFKCYISFDSWHGYYGNSGCSNVICIRDAKQAETSFVNYLREHETEILQWMAKDMLNKANEMKQAALKEIEANKAFIESIDEEDNPK